MAAQIINIEDSQSWLPDRIKELLKYTPVPRCHPLKILIQLILSGAGCLYVLNENNPYIYSEFLDYLKNEKIIIIEKLLLF